MSDTEETPPSMAVAVSSHDEEQKIIDEMKIADNARRHARNAQPKLDDARLTSDQGLPALAEHMRAWRPRSGRDEFGQLDDVMNIVENWAHRLYPKYKFDDFLAQAYKLGSKRAVKACMHRLRTGELDEMNKNDDVDAPTTAAEPSATLVADVAPIVDTAPTMVDFNDLEEGDFMDDMPDEEDLAEFDAQLHHASSTTTANESRRIPPPPTSPTTAPVFEQAAKRRRIASSSEEDDDEAFEAYLKAQRVDKRAMNVPPTEEKQVVENEESTMGEESKEKENIEEETTASEKSVNADEALEMLIEH